MHGHRMLCASIGFRSRLLAARSAMAVRVSRVALYAFVVGAGISGIGAACHLRAKCKGKTFTILEARDAIGGTWDLFRYPGIRSDSDMYTLGFPFRPWKGDKSIADGPSILAYVRETAAEPADHGIAEA